MPDTPRIRPAVRAVVTDPEHRVLLVHFDFPWDATLPMGLWACPGGGIDPGESAAGGLRRELLEELGLEIDDPGTAVWHREQLFPMARWDGQHDTFYWLEVDAFEPRPHLSAEQLRDEHVDAIRWWTYAEVRAAQRAYDAHDTDDPAYAVLSPRDLGHRLSELFTNGRPAPPIELDPY
jgi:8-oxo-dGTP pyrophosphatase MutT (NUDIX family)